MYYQVSQEFFEKLPNACFGAVAVRGLDNTHDIPQLEQMLAENVAACEAYFAGKKPKETEDILPYRNAFTALGINPNKFLCSIEALLTRIAKGKGFPHINAAVDLGNAVSIKHRLPMGAHDLDTIDEGLDVRLAKEGDTFIPFGSTEEETPDMGEAVYASGSEIRTRRWTWRQSERGKITEETKAILFPIDGFSDVNADEVQAAADGRPRGGPPSGAAAPWNAVPYGYTSLPAQCMRACPALDAGTAPDRQQNTGGAGAGKFSLTAGAFAPIIERLTGCSAVGSALGSGPRGRGFKSPHSDHKSTVILTELRWTFLSNVNN